MADETLKKVYSARTFDEAALLAQDLQAAGIRTQIMNAALQGVLGEVPFQIAAPSLCVMSDDYDQARKFIEQRFQSAAAAGQESTEWTCPRCSEVNGPAFDECWNCQWDRQRT